MLVTVTGFTEPALTLCYQKDIRYTLNRAKTRQTKSSLEESINSVIGGKGI
jgi:hypothetical protein